MATALDIEISLGSTQKLVEESSQALAAACSDRFGAYLKYHKGQAQFCWAHLERRCPVGPAQALR